MTRKQHRKNKSLRLENKNNYSSLCNERPEWADYEKEDNSFKKWRENFLKEIHAAIKLRTA